MSAPFTVRQEARIIELISDAIGNGCGMPSAAHRWRSDRLIAQLEVMRQSTHGEPQIPETERATSMNQETRSINSELAMECLRLVAQNINFASPPDAIRWVEAFYGFATNGTMPNRYQPDINHKMFMAELRRLDPDNATLHHVEKAFQNA